MRCGARVGALDRDGDPAVAHRLAVGGPWRHLAWRGAVRARRLRGGQRRCGGHWRKGVVSAIVEHHRRSGGC